MLNDKLFYIVTSIIISFRIVQSAELFLRSKNDDILFKLRESNVEGDVFAGTAAGR